MLLSGRFLLSYLQMGLGLLAGLWLASCHSSASSAPPLARYAAELRAARTRQSQPASYAATVGIYIDLRRPDTENRLFVLDLRTGRALLAAPCCNGRLNRQGHIRYSNALNSCCSSRGLAWTSFDQAYTGQFGLSYRLHGLSAGTTNLAARAVVLHGWRRVPASPELVDGELVRSWGCPAVAPSQLAKLAQHLQAQSDRRVLVCMH